MTHVVKPTLHCLPSLQVSQPSLQEQRWLQFPLSGVVGLSVDVGGVGFFVVAFSAVLVVPMVVVVVVVLPVVVVVFFAVVVLVVVVVVVVVVGAVVVEIVEVVVLVVVLVVVVVVVMVIVVVVVVVVVLVVVVSWQSCSALHTTPHSLSYTSLKPFLGSITPLLMVQNLDQQA